MDLVEVAPPYDCSQRTAQLAAWLIIDVLAARFPSRKRLNGEGLTRTKY
jgi:arginase family enzyme